MGYQKDIHSRKLWFYHFRSYVWSMV